MGSDAGNDSGAPGANSDPSSHSDYGGNYGGPGVSGGGLNSDPSSHVDYGGNYSGESDTGGWSSFLDHIQGILGFASASSSLGLGPVPGIAAYGFTQIVDYAYNNPTTGTYAAPVDPGIGATGAEISKPSVQSKPVTAYNGHPDWNSFLADINSRFRTRAANQPTDFTSLLES